jgi:predicted PurR-regulated permease PerM
MNTARASAQSAINKRTKRLFALLLAGAFLVPFLLMVAPFFEALVLAAVFTGLLYPVYTRVLRRMKRESLAALVTTLLALLVVVLPLTVLIGVTAKEALKVSEVVAPLVDGNGDLRELAGVVPRWLPYREQALQRAGDVIKQTGTFVVDRLTKATQSTVIFLLNLFVMLYAMFSLFVHGPRLLAYLDRYTPLGGEDKREILKKGIAVTRATLKSLFVIGALQGTLGGIAFAMVGIQNPVFWGIVMAVASALPSIGTALIWIPAVVALYLRGEGAQALALCAWCAIVVSSLDNVLRPHLVGNDARMPDLIVLLSTLGGIAMFGVAGIIIGPVLAGLFLTSLDIVTAAFDRELKGGADTPPSLISGAAPVRRTAR